MDIRSWLQNTADRAPPDQSDGVNIRRFLPHQQKALETDGCNYRQKKRRRTSSDSSVITLKSMHHRAKASAHRQSVKHVYDTPGFSTSSRRSASSRSRHKTPGEKPVKTYERRARHKTKLDRYEPKTKKESGLRKVKKSAQRRRKSHDNERTRGLVQNFHLKTAPKNSRLTLKPDVRAGLFKHGRASMQMTGRGNGLPDLVFNEMKFLKRPMEHQDEPAEVVQQRHDSKNDRKRAHDEDISAYFATNRVEDAERSRVPTKLQKKPRANESDKNYRHRYERDRKSAPIELPEKPFLGFGSKGAQLESNQLYRQSNSSLAWSESPPGHSLPAQKPLEPPFKQQATRQMSQRRSQGADLVLNGHECRHDNCKGRDSGAEGRIQSTRTRGQVLVEISQPPAAHKRTERQNDRSMTKTTMQSLPRYQSHDDLVDRKSVNETDQNDRLRSTYRTSDILDIQNLCQSPMEQVKTNCDEHGQEHRNPTDKENKAPDPSIDQLINHAHEAVVKRTSLRRPGRQLTEGRIDLGNFQLPHVMAKDISRLHRKPLDQLHGQRHSRHSIRAIESEKRISAGRHQLPPKADTTRGMIGQSMHLQSGHGKTHGVRWRLVMPPNDDDEMLEYDPGIEEPPFVDNHVCMRGGQPQELALRATSVPRSGIYRAQLEHLEGESNARSLMRESLATEALSTHGISFEPEVSNERFGGAQDEMCEQLAGFWRPNKLY